MNYILEGVARSFRNYVNYVQIHKKKKNKYCAP